MLNDQFAELSDNHKTLILLEKLQQRIRDYESQYHQDIAVVGMAFRLPAGVSRAQDYWRLIKNATSLITDIPPSKWNNARYYHEDSRQPGKLYMRHGAFLQDADHFDAKLFGISPAEARSMDPQHRLLLEVCWEAFENAGTPPKTKCSRPFGVFVGIGQNDYSLLQAGSNPAGIDAHTCTGNGFCFASGRLAHILNLNGPNMSVDTACSSSLVAIHLACQAIRNGECDTALAGGVQIMMSPETSISLSKAGALSRSGKCSVFDDSADGFVRGEGCGVLVLKRLSDAEKNNDNIIGIIRGSAVNHNGRSSGLTVPNGESQQQVIEAALKQARVEPHEVGYVEAHGTGTRLGDPIELEALQAVYGKKREQPLYVGSTKSTTGHAEAAAGVIGVIKCLLALQHQSIPPHRVSGKPNSYFDWDRSSLTLASEALAWEADDNRRFAGISSFGLSGTNAHLIVQQYHGRLKPSGMTRPPFSLFCISSHTPAGLIEQAAVYLDYLKDHTGDGLAGMAYSVNKGRSHLPYRKAFVCADKKALETQLRQFVDSADETRIEKRHDGKIAFLFTGQGSQYINMGRELYQIHDGFRRLVDQCDEIVKHKMGYSLADFLYPETTDESAFSETAYIQPCLFVIEYGLYRLWDDWGIKPALLMGHSLGEYVAACAAGVFSLQDALNLVCERARLSTELPVKGNMLAMAMDELQARKLIGEYGKSLSVSVINEAQSVVVSGEAQEIDKLAAEVETKGVYCKKLNISAPFHSSLMQPMVKAFEKVFAGMTLQPPSVDIITNVDGEKGGDKMADARYWSRHLTQTVQFHKGIQQLGREDIDVLLEIGPKPVLLPLVKKQIKDKRLLWLTSLAPAASNYRTMLESLGRLYEAGGEINWDGFYCDMPVEWVSLPNYAFQRKPYWIEPPREDVEVMTNTTEQKDQKPVEKPQATLDDVIKIFQSQNNILMQMLSTTSGSAALQTVAEATTEEIRQPSPDLSERKSDREKSMALLQAVSRITGIPVDEINMKDSLVDDLGFDSISFAQLIAASENQLKLSPDQLTPQFLSTHPTLEQLLDGDSEQNPLFRYQDIDELLGDHRKRFFGEGFKKIQYKITTTTFSDDLQSMEADACVLYPRDWSGKKGQGRLKPHLSVLDALLIALQVNEYMLVNAVGLSDEQQGNIWVRALHMKAGVLPELDLKHVRVASRLKQKTAADSPHTVNYVFATNIGPISVEMEMLAADVPEGRPGSHEAQTFFSRLSESYYGGGYRRDGQAIKDITIDTGLQKIHSTVAKRGADTTYTTGQGKAYFPCLSWIDLLMIVGQLVQALVYKIDHLSRDNTNNLWMREIRAVYDKPTNEPLCGDLTVEKSEIVAMNGKRWRYADLSGELGPVKGFVSVTHQLREENNHE